MQTKLNELLNNAYAPYSHYKVAAIIEMNDGSYFNGVNVENASYGASVCAERIAIFSAITNGYKKSDFKTLHLMNSSHNLAYPCQLCLQVMEEFFTEDTQIIIYAKNKKTIVDIDDLVPHPFTKKDLPL